MSTVGDSDALDLEQVMHAAQRADGPGEVLRVWEQAHHGFLNRGDVEAAARCAVWLGMALLDRAEYARAGGWIARARRLLEDGHHDCVEQGYLLMPAAVQAMAQGRFEQAILLSEQQIEIGKRFKDQDLVIMSRHGQGRVRIRARQFAEGLAHWTR
jgi:hypothetical protein